MEAVDVARGIVAELFPDAVTALLAGSVARGDATATSDLDVVVLLDRPPAPYRETLRRDGVPVELFVHTGESLASYVDREAAERRSTLADMVATGIVLVGEDAATAVRADVRRRLADGPAPLTDAERDLRRYGLTDLLDDLAGATTADERDAVASHLWQQTAELALLVDRQWLGRGKWLLRRLVGHDAGLAARLMASHRAAVADLGTGELAAVVDEVLDRVGGRLTEGFRAEGPRRA